ncbi:hypothetical protein ACQKL8_19095 [Pedobacter suwonensis]|uniref:hypothetical protein n=1 Tax=Pedobacter suwonensis TaxID=332999 RepID=UPI0037F59783
MKSKYLQIIALLCTGLLCAISFSLSAQNNIVGKINEAGSGKILQSSSISVCFARLRNIVFCGALA